jgi:hypothetical protein
VVGRVVSRDVVCGDLKSYTRSATKHAAPQQHNTNILTNTHAVLVLESYATGKQTSSSARMTLFPRKKKTIDTGREGTHLEEVECECSEL